MELFGVGEAYHSRISSYSKGMRQKLLIIASLIHNPDLLFLDEPINGLDANSVMIFKEILTQLAANGKTIFYSSHIMDVVEKSVAVSFCCMMEKLQRTEHLPNYKQIILKEH